MILPGTKEYGANYAAGALKSYLNGEKTTNWLIGMFESALQAHKLPEGELETIFNTYEDFGDTQRWTEAKDVCEEKGWFHNN